MRYTEAVARQTTGAHLVTDHRVLLSIILDSDGTIRLSTLVSRVRERLFDDEYETEDGAIDITLESTLDDHAAISKAPIRMALLHGSLPRLAHEGFIAYTLEKNSITITVGPRFRSEDPQLITESLADSAVRSRIANALSHPRRRAILSVLSSMQTSLSTQSLSVFVTALERDGALGTSEVSDPGIEQTTLSLVHTHLPRLADLGLISYDPAAGSVDPAQPEVLGVSGAGATSTTDATD